MTTLGERLKTGSRVVAAFGAAIALLALSLAAAYGGKRLVGTSTGVLAALLAVPLVTFLVVGRYVSELSGPGGWAVKVAQAARQPVRRQSIGANNTKLVEKADEKELDRELRGFDDSKPIAMTIVVEPNSYYTSDAMSLYLDRLAEFTRFEFVVFVGPDRVHIGHVRPVVLRNLLRDSDRSSRFIERLNIGKVAIELSTATIRTESAALEALREMDEKDVNALVVTDALERFEGIIERETLLTRMIRPLLEESAEASGP